MLEIIILLSAGIGAGIITGLVSASAVTVMAPLLVVMLGYPPYMAIGIALAVDVFSSAAATIIYKRYKRVRVKPSLILLFFALAATIAGSYVSVDIPPLVLSLASGAGIVLAGFFIYKKENGKSAIFPHEVTFFKKHRNLSLVLIGLWVGTIAGIFGAGGGIMILTGLTLILDYDTHEAIGTSVFLMIFIALLGGAVHYVNWPFPGQALLWGSIGGVAGSFASSRIVNNFREVNLNKILGVIILTLGLLLILKPFL